MTWFPTTWAIQSKLLCPKGSILAKSNLILLLDTSLRTYNSDSSGIVGSHNPTPTHQIIMSDTVMIDNNNDRFSYNYYELFSSMYMVTFIMTYIYKVCHDHYDLNRHDHNDSYSHSLYESIWSIWPWEWRLHYDLEEARFSRQSL